MKIKTKQWIILSVVIVVIGLIVGGVLLFQNRNSGAPDGAARLYHQFPSTKFATENGLYYSNTSGFLRFYDFASGEDVLVCNKPNCKHQIWYDTTPEERRCNAYPAGITGFIANDQLYIMEKDENLTHMILIRSALDRSGQVQVAEIESDIMLSMVVKDNMLYLPCIKMVTEIGEDGMPIGTGENDTWMYTINLESGEMTEAIPTRRNYVAELRAIGVEGDIIYLSYGYSEQKNESNSFDPTHYHSELYIYNMETGEYQEWPVELDDTMIFDRVIGQKLIACKYIDKDETRQVYEIDLETGETKEIGVSQGTLDYLDGDLFLATEDGYDRYDMETGEKEKMEMSSLSGFYIFLDAGNYIYGSKSNAEKEFSDLVLISKEDFYHNNPNYIYLKYDDSVS